MSKEIEFKINKDLKEYEEYVVSCISKELLYKPSYTEGKNFKADDFENDLGVISYYGKNFVRVDNKSKLKKDCYFVSDDGHYIFSKSNDGEKVYIRYNEKEEVEVEVKPRYIFGVGELKFTDKYYNERINTLFTKNVNEYLEEHGKDLSIQRTEFLITTPNAESFKEKQKNKGAEAFHLSNGKKITFLKDIDKVILETPKKEFYNRILKFNGTSYDKLFDREIVDVLGTDNIFNIIDVVDDFEEYLKYIGYEDYMEYMSGFYEHYTDCLMSFHKFKKYVKV